MNQENRLPKAVRDRARAAGGSREWSDNLWNNLSSEKRRAVEAAVQEARVFSDLTEAVKFAASREEKEHFVFVVAPWEMTTPEYRVVSSSDMRKHGVDISFIHFRIVVAAGMLQDALKALTADNTDTIEEI